jgi:hypothetical protein
MEPFDCAALPCKPPDALQRNESAREISVRGQGGSETLNAILMISVLVVAACMFLALSIIMGHGMRHHSAGLLMEHHEAPEVAPPVSPIREDAG